MTTHTHTELAARLREAHDLSLDGNHFDARIAVLNVAAALESPERVQGEPVAYAVMLPSGRVSRTRNTAERAQRHVDDWNRRYPRPPHAYVAPLGALSATPPPQAERVPLSEALIKANHDLAVENHALKEHIAALNRGESPTFDPFKGHKEHQTRQTPYGPATSFQAVTPEPNCRYPDCKCPTESPCLQGLPPAPLSEDHPRITPNEGT